MSLMSVYIQTRALLAICSRGSVPSVDICTLSLSLSLSLLPLSPFHFTSSTADEVNQILCKVRSHRDPMRYGAHAQCCAAPRDTVYRAARHVTSTHGTACDASGVNEL